MTLLAELDLSDILILSAVLFAMMGGTAWFTRRNGGDAAVQERLNRMEDKLNMLMTHVGVDYVPSTKQRWQRMAEGRDIEGAIEDYVESHDVSHEEAALIVRQYLEDMKRIE